MYLDIILSVSSPMFYIYNIMLYDALYNHGYISLIIQENKRKTKQK